MNLQKWIICVGFSLEFRFLVGAFDFLRQCAKPYTGPCRSDLIKFTLSARINNRTSYHDLDLYKLKLPLNFDTSIPLKILIHGFGGLKKNKIIVNIFHSYEKRGYNIILVDWSPLSETSCYKTSFGNTWHVGQCVAVLAINLISSGINPNLLHLVGFSLGAHTAGFVGEKLQTILKIAPGRITGLDPSLPLFIMRQNGKKLDKSDATFVDVIHTSAGSLGKIEAVGHVDFYVNGGALQPACYNTSRPYVCSHKMSGLYFAKSIQNEDTFIGIQCDNIANYLIGLCNRRPKALMGEYVDHWRRGKFYVDISNYDKVQLGKVSK